MQLEDVFGGHGTWMVVLDIIGFLMVYVGLKVAFVYGTAADYGQTSYGRDMDDRPIADNDWIEEILQFIIIQTFWLIVLFVRLPFWLYGWRIIFRACGWRTT